MIVPSPKGGRHAHLAFVGFPWPSSSPATVPGYLAGLLVPGPSTRSYRFLLLPRRPIGIRSVTVVRGDRFAWLDYTNRPVTADRTRVTKLLLACLRAMARRYPARGSCPRRAVSSIIAPFQ